MTSYFYENYFNSVPDDVELILKSLSHNIRFKICINLINRGSLSFSKLIQVLKIDNSKFSNHIKSLEIAGLVQNYYERKEGRRESSFYEMTKLGSNIVTNLIESYNRDFNIKNVDRILLDSLPKEYIDILKAISNKLRFSLLLCLTDKEELSFSEIGEFLGKEKGTISSHLKKLEISGVLENFYKKSKENKDYSFYRITSMGNNLLKGFLKCYNEFYDTKLETISIGSN